MRQTKKIIASALSVLLICTTPVSAIAAEKLNEKEEVIYITANANGGIENVNAVNIFGSGDITDYGNYSSVKVLTSNDTIKKDKDKITFTTSAEKIYYQGTMEEAEIPWTISIQYFLDGKKYSAEEIAGKSGDLEIRFTVTQNKLCSGDFYDQYALQGAFVLDTNFCKNITATDATIANLGAKKQLTFTILPGKGMDTSIKAKVTDFQMEAVSINGIRLNLNIEIDDSELMEKVNELMDATKKLNDGAKELKGGTADLEDGTTTLKNGIGILDSGTKELDTGVTSLQSGITRIQKGLDELNNKSNSLTNGSAEVKKSLITIQKKLSAVSVSTDQLTELTAASGAIKKGIRDISDGILALQQNLGYAQYQASMKQNGLDIDALREGNSQAIKLLSAQMDALEKKLSQIPDTDKNNSLKTELQTQITSLQTTIQLLKGSNAAIGGTEAYLNTLSEAASELSEGASALKENYDAFDTAITKLAGSLEGLLFNMSELTNGIQTLVTKYTELDSGISEYTDGVAKVTSGFAELKNGSVSLTAGSTKLLSGANDLSGGADELYDGVLKLSDGASELAAGTDELYSKTNTMDSQVQEEIDAMTNSLGADDTEPISFVSEKNKNVKSLQFVIKTSEIKKAETVTEGDKEAAPLTFWQKLKNLF